MPKVSVIIPVYNAEKYISRTLDSVLKQTFKDFEVLCINDCSTDNSLKILEEFAKKDSRIKIVMHDKNKGVSAARNTGIDYAQGKYLYFLDSDDWLDNNYIESMFYTIEKTDADIVYNRNIIFVYEDYCKEYKPTGIEINLKDDTFIDIPKYAHGISCYIWSKLFKKDFIQKYNIKYPEGYHHEDVFFNYASLGCAQNLYYFKGPAYYYLNRQNSITDIYNERSSSTKIFELVYNFYKERNLLNKNIKIFYIAPSFRVDNEKTYEEFKNYFMKAGNYIQNSGVFNDLECFLCNNILNTKNYEDYISKYQTNVAISFIRSKQ